MEHVRILCNKYCALHKALKGKDAYINLQIQWFDYVRSLAVYTEEQLLEDAQIVDAFVDGENEWLSIATSVSIRNDEFDKANQFAMLHAVARLVYLTFSLIINTGRQGEKCDL